MKIRTKNITLKSGGKLKLFSPAPKDEQQSADHFNTIITETDYIMSAPEDGFAAEHELDYWKKWNNNER